MTTWLLNAFIRMKRVRRSSRISKKKKQKITRKKPSSEEQEDGTKSFEQLPPKCDSKTDAMDKEENQTSSSLSEKQESAECDVTEQPTEHPVYTLSDTVLEFCDIPVGSTCEVVSTEESIATEDNKTMPDFYFQDEDGDTYLHIAVVQCNEGLVNFLIKSMKTKKIDIYNNLRQTPLHLAVITGQRNLIGLLIKAGCDVNAMDRNGQTPLHLACQRGDIESARAIFESVSSDSDAINLNSKNFEGFSPLHLAAVTGNRDLIGLIIDKGADINIKDACSGRTALHHAVEAGKYFVVEYFLSRGASANVTTYTGNTPLHTASGRRMDEMIKLLSNYGADVNLANMEGDKPKVVQASEQSKRQLEASRKRTKKQKPSSSSTSSSSGEPPERKPRST